MYLKKIHIENFRLLKDINIDLDKSLTLVVGKNNTGKTSIVHLIRFVLNEKKNLSIDDYPLECRKALYETIEKYWANQLKDTEIKNNIAETKVTFFIDYSDEGEDDFLGELRNFIIDVDDSQNIAQIDAVYAFNSLHATELFSICRNRYNELLNAKYENELLPKEGFDRSITMAVVKEQFSKLFSLVVYAVNPNDYTDYQERSPSLLHNIFTCAVIDAERDLGENENKNEHPLLNIMNRVFSQDEEQLTEEFRPMADNLNQYITQVNFTAQEKINALMDKIIENMIYFGYPTAEDMRLQANTDISLKQQILNSTDLTYISANSEESLPSTHNGLGYKNLIKITFMLHNFAQEIMQNSASIPLLLMEEPEAHMHPQLQISFLGFLNKFMEKAVGKNKIVQIIISTHSSHIANTVSFKQVRYMRRKQQYVICKDLQDFYESAQSEDEKKENLEFLQKYLKLSYCDLYFCDKAILVEGAAERLLVPTIISKCDEAELFGKEKPTLASQYYTIVEVGGAYAHRFYEFVDFLEIPTLILTDIDFVDDTGKKCQLSAAVRSSNGAINRWCRDKYNIACSKTVSIATVLALAQDPQKRNNGYRHIEFQLEEYSAHPRSLEESIQNVNRELFGIDKISNEIPIFNEEEQGKTAFALMLLTDEKYENFTIPSYIQNGLIWLNDQDKMPDSKTASRKSKGKRSLTVKKV